MNPATRQSTIQSTESTIGEPELHQTTTKKARLGTFECSTALPLLECETRELLREPRNVAAAAPHEFHNMLPDFRVQEQLVCRLAEQNSITSIDKFSLENMAAALFYSGITSFDEVLQLGLKIIPPGPVFHTWYAYHGTTLFDGVNNDKKLDYVTLIGEEASRLSKSNIPLLLIYTNNSMTMDQIKIMNDLFVDHDNVLVISIEEDLSDLPMLDKFKAQKTNSIVLMDSVRVCAIVDARRVLSIARHKSKQLGKEFLLKRLALLEDQSLTYNDIDNVFIRPASFQIAANGFCKTSHLTFHGIFINDEAIKGLTRSMKDRAKVHNGYFQYLHDYGLMNVQELEQKSERLFWYFVSGRAHREYQEIMNQTDTMEDWGEETNYYTSRADLLSDKDIELIMAGKFPRDAFFDHLKTLSHCHENREKLSRLEGIQQIRLIKMNYHRSWEKV